MTKFKRMMLTASLCATLLTVFGILKSSGGQPVAPKVIDDHKEKARAEGNKHILRQKLADSYVLSSLDSRVASSEPLELFVGPPPAVIPPPVSPPAFVVQDTPSAPPLPFEFLGRYKDSDKEAVFVRYMNRSFPLHAGEIVEGLYQVVSINEREMVFVYLPLRQNQILAINSLK
jgi:hypothetical protein